MKKYLKDTYIMYLISIIFSFMLFIFEPINLYASNINDFWFNLKILIQPSFIAFLLLLLGIIIFMNVVYFINKKAFKIFTIIEFIVFLCSYIQGNYLVGDLPVLDGTIINWSGFRVQNIITIIMWIIVISVTIILCKKKKMDKYIKYSSYIVLAIFGMISISLVTTLLTKNFSKADDVISVATTKDLNKYSTKENFIIFVIDAADSKHYLNAIKNNKEFNNIFKDFTYYPDTLSLYPFTQESIPFILSGNIFENQENYLDYYVNTMNNSSLINELSKNNYEINIYEEDFYYNDKEALKLNNIVNLLDSSIMGYNTKKFIKQEIKYVLFRYLPYFGKRYSKIESLDFNFAKSINCEDEIFSPDVINFAQSIKNKVSFDENKNFKFIHIDGSHVPFTFNKNLDIIDNATYQDEVEGCLTLTNQYLNMLKENNIYDNSIIIVMSDHGFGMDSNGNQRLEGRQNPILFIKGYNEKHDKMTTSNKAISYIDLKEAYSDLLKNKKSAEIFKNIGSSRTRKYILYEFTKENHMIEYETKSKAWETDKLYKTGKEFDLR